MGFGKLRIWHDACRGISYRLLATRKVAGRTLIALYFHLVCLRAQVLAEDSGELMRRSYLNHFNRFIFLNDVAWVELGTTACNLRGLL